LVCLAVWFVPSWGQGDTQRATAPTAAADSASAQNPSELASHDEPIAFKSNANLVVVRVVVRDSRGRAVGNLHQEDFQVFDKGKLQIVSHFDVESNTRPSPTTEPKAPAKSGQAASVDHSDSGGIAPAVPGRFVAYLFDDVDLEFGDLAHVRDAATRHLATLQPADRAAIFTTSGMVVLDFTNDRARLNEALLRVQPQQKNQLTNLEHECPYITLYEADLIINKDDRDAQQMATNEAQQCRGGGNSALMVQNAAQAVLSIGEQQSLLALNMLQDVVRSISRMPGERSVVMVSPGFLTPNLDSKYYEIIDQAVRAQVLVNALDTRGLFVTIPYGDASQQPSVRPGDSQALSTGPATGSTVSVPATSKTLVQVAAAQANDDVLAALADGTGGVFFHSNNDFDEGFRRVGGSPEYSYVLGFAPQNLKLDGSFHPLKVTLKNPRKLTLQARRGYFAPKNFLSPDEQSKEEIQDAMYSQEEMHDLPVKLRTQFFKASDDVVKLIVLAHVDVKQLRFRKLQGRNDNVLTCVFALFNSNGRFVEGLQKTVTMDLKDETLEHKLAAGITLKTSFDVKPGSYLVRLVVRDAEAKLMSAENGALEIR